MKPQAYEALQKAKALFAHPSEVRREAKDDIPEQITQAPEPIRKPRVVLLPPNAPKFDKETMKQEHKQEKQIDKYVEMSVTQAVEACLAKGIKKPQAIAKETGKNVNQIYTAMWKVKQRKAKAKREAKERKSVYDENGVNTTNSFNTPPTLTHEQFDWEKREPLAWEDAHRVVLKTREEYEEKIDALCMQRNKLEDEVKELKTIIKYLEGRVK